MLTAIEQKKENFKKSIKTKKQRDKGSYSNLTGTREIVNFALNAEERKMLKQLIEKILNVLPTKDDTVKKFEKAKNQIENLPIPESMKKEMIAKLEKNKPKNNKTVNTQAYNAATWVMSSLSLVKKAIES